MQQDCGISSNGRQVRMCQTYFKIPFHWRRAPLRDPAAAKKNMWPDNFQPAFEAPNPNIVEPLCFAFLGDQILLDAANQLPAHGALSGLGQPLSAFVIGYIDARPCLAVLWKKSATPPAGLFPTLLHNSLDRFAMGYWNIAARAKQMFGWDIASRFCGSCGKPTEIARNEPAKICTACSRRNFPQIAPAVLVLVHRVRELLLARAPHFEAGYYSTLAGFLETGENVAACIKREVFEETGIQIKNLRWFDSQPWPFPNALMLAFHADYADGEIIPQKSEIEDAKWFDIDLLPLIPMPQSIAARLIEDGIRLIRAKDQAA